MCVCVYLARLATLHHQFADLSIFPHCIVARSLVSTFFLFVTIYAYWGISKYVLLIYCRMAIVEYDVMSSCCTASWCRLQAESVLVCVFFLCARPVSSSGQAVRTISVYKFSPAGVGQGPRRKGNPQPTWSKCVLCVK